MQTTALKKEAKKAIDELSEEKIKVAIDFIDYLKPKLSDTYTHIVTKPYRFLHTQE